MNILKATKRTTASTGQINKLRSEGFIPAILYGGEKNQVFPTPLGKWVQSQIPNSELVIFNDSGHAPFWEESEKYNESIIRFIEG